MSTNEGCPVAIDIWFAFRQTEVASALKLLTAEVSRVIRAQKS